MMMEKSPTAIAPLLLRNLLTSIFLYADKPLVSLTQKYKFLDVIRYMLVSIFLFFLRILPSFFSSLVPFDGSYDYPLKPKKGEIYPVPTRGAGGGGGGGGGSGDSGIARALSQLLSLINDIPVSSRKYEVVRSLAEKIIDENLSENNEALREINCKVLSAAFSRTLSQLEAAVLDQGRSRGGGSGDVSADEYFYRLSRFLRGLKYFSEVLWQSVRKPRDELNCNGSSAEKLAADLLWLAPKMAASGCADEAVCKWASASHLAWLALSAESRLQGSLVKVSAFLFKQAKDMGKEEDDECGKNDELRRTKARMLMSWLPLLCRGSKGTDAPILNTGERAELEKTLEEMIDKLEEEEQQEKVLSLWLHHFTYCASSDWPNLHECFTRWCNASRKILIRQ